MRAAAAFLLLLTTLPAHSSASIGPSPIFSLDPTFVAEYPATVLRNGCSPPVPSGAVIQP